ncbi:hypothetical protein HMPREF3038_01048 [Akkermansia sp. KLE1797]|nr:hypothetical protein HMPREF3038_01048 [Akkermansia sp. KLE1797]KXU53410.1 hypothetical protein HMPREF3039_02411 [Akkermansia sp. KLE1798]
MVISLSLCKAQAKVRAIYTRLSRLSIRTAMAAHAGKDMPRNPGASRKLFHFSMKSSSAGQ